MDVEKYRRVAQALAESKRLNTELEERVRQKQLELERSFDALQRLSRDAAIVEERRRILADMHDSIGAQLISTLSLVESGEASKQQLAAALRECLDDLRLAIDSLEPTDDDLLPVLGNLRYRLEPRLRASGIALDWQVTDVPRLACLTPQNVLHVLRILQEAFTNVLKHAGATTVRVSTRVDADGVHIDVADNGHGFACPDSFVAGRGIASMRQRALTVGGRLAIVPSPAGTTLSLRLPTR